MQFALLHALPDSAASKAPPTNQKMDPTTREASVILLDALGTLVSLESPAPRLRAELADRFGLAVSAEQAAEAIAAEIAYYRAHLEEGRDRASLQALRSRCAEVLRSALPDAAGIEPSRMVEALLASLRFTAFSDARPALLAARARGQRLVVVSNWDVSLHDVLQALGLEPLLDGILTSAEVGERKPAPAMFERALALVGGRPTQAIHVGDSFDEDVAGARAAGIEAVLISRDGGEPAPGVPTISSLAELVDLEPTRRALKS
ncbi:MAG TPA: HAD family hydrolase [Solirubrobacteraceae bacterium]|nr:HAD family hydrolase [Solirubrobacteraceae bacterium]